MFNNFKFAFGRFLVTLSFSLTKALVAFAATAGNFLEERGWKLIARSSEDVAAISAFAKSHYAKMGINVEVYDARSPQALEALAARDDGYEAMESPRRNGSSGGYYN